MYEGDGLVMLEARPSEGFEFVGWTGDVDGIADTTQSAVTVKMSSNRAIVANFAAPGGLYTVTLDTSPYWGGSATIDTPCGLSFVADNIQSTISVQVAGGTELSLAATAAEGYRFRGWKGDLSGVEDATFVVESDMTITAKFEKPHSFPWGWVGGVLVFGAASIVIAKFTVLKGRKGGETPGDGGSPAQPS